MSITPEEYSSALAAACGGNLAAAVLYGSSAAGDAIPGRSGHNMALLLKRTGPAELAALAAASRVWLKAGNPAPMIFTPEQFAGSADSFPIELADMKEFHRVLYGEDPLASVAIDPADLRLAVEREIKSKLLLLRKTCVAVGGDRRAIEDLMTGSLSQFLVLCRAALRLKEAKVPSSKLECAEKLAAHAGFDPAAFREVHALKAGGPRPSAEASAALFARYLAAVEAFAAAVDAWDGK